MKNIELTATDLQLRKLTLFSSGVGFYEYSGEIVGSKELNLPFNSGTINDALKSIVINDPDASPTVNYHAEQTLERTLKGLSVDLYQNHHIAGLLNSLKGAEIEVLTPTSIKGKIMLVEYRYASDSGEKLSKINEREAFLSLLTADGIRIIALREISGFSFNNPKINADMNRALDLIMQSRDSDTKNLTVKLPGQKERKVSLSYVIPTPVWKVSYRLDLSKEKPFLQGWAIVDNDSDTDWENIQLALVAGRPVSFTQNLYSPYHLPRPTLPLSLDGLAEARTYDSGTPKARMKAKRAGPPACDGSSALEQCQIEGLLCCSASGGLAYAEEESFSLMEGVLETADGSTAGEQFEYTVKNPVSLERQQSAMLPLVEGAVQAEKMLVFSANRATPNQQMNPAIGAELTNNTGMKLPAGSITVYDGGTYAGDSLIAFFPEGEKRIISYGEDLSVIGHFSYSNRHITSVVVINNGVMIFKQTIKYEYIYLFRNASNETKRLIVEHPFNSDATLISPASYMEKTGNLYRFELSLPPGELCLEVKEEQPYSKEVALSSLGINDFVRYTTDKELSESIRAGLQKAVVLLQKIDAEKNKLSAWQKRLKHLYGEQERTRKNLEAAGSQTQQGQYYLNLLASQENEILAANSAIVEFEKVVESAKQEYDAYIQEMFLEETCYLSIVSGEQSLPS